jgi:uncharacterized protein (TIGR03790 family)
LVTVVWLLRSAGGAAESDAPSDWVSAQDVLVLFNLNWPDEDGNHRSDSQDVAEYYASRRGIPADHLLGLTVTEREAKPDRMSYVAFFERVLVPTRKRLAELAARGAHIQYVVTCYGMPLAVTTGLDGRQSEHPIWRPSNADASTRTLTGWLVNIEENFEAGFDSRTGKPGPRGGKSAAPGSAPLGSGLQDIAMDWLRGAFDRPGVSSSFKTLRWASPARSETYLVTHLGGTTLEISLGLVDKALYGERYLQNLAGRQAHPYYARVWLDHNGGDGAGHRPSLLTAALWFKGLMSTSVFAPVNQALPWYQGPPWDVRMDNVESEIGAKTSKESGAPLHTPTVTGTVERVDATTRVVTLASSGNPSPAVYFPIGEIIESSGKGHAEVLALTSPSALKLSTAEGFAPGNTVTWRQAARFPLTDVLFYYGYYGLAQYHDVYQFRVGAVGAHMDSESIVWAKAAMRRGITATAGAINEPSAGGVPFMGSAFAALTRGHDVAEAFYSAIRYNTRWNTVVFGDPLYAPFRIRDKRPDVTAPVIDRFTLTPLRAPGGDRQVLVRAQLASATPDQATDVALWQLEYGLTPQYGSVVPYIEWPAPEDDKFVEGRRYEYTRRFAYELRGLLPGHQYYIRISARDPFGNVGTATSTVTTLR